MAAKLPNLTVPVLLVAALAAVGTWVWADRGRAPMVPQSAGQSLPPEQLAATSEAAKRLLERAIVTLESHESLSAQVRQSGSMFGQEPIGSGFYCQQQFGDKLLFRFDLRIQLGEEAGSLVHVRDDEGHLWTYEKVPGQEAELSRIDVERVEERLRETGQTARLGGMGGGLGLGGLPKLLRSLRDTFDFVSVEETVLGDQFEVWKLEGRFNPQRLAEMLPESGQGAAGVDPSELPPQLPERVVLMLGKEDLFPWLLEYRRQSFSQRAEEDWPAPWFMRLEMHAVKVNVPIPKTRFMFPTTLDYTDKTDAFIDSLTPPSAKQR